MARQVSLDKLDFKTFTMGPNYPQIDSYQLVYDARREVCAFRVRCSWPEVFRVEVESAVQLGNLVALPFVLSAQAKQLRFTTQLQLHGDHLEIFCLPDDNFLLELEIGSLVGHRTKLKDLPKITAGIVEIIKKVLSETLIYPRSLRIPLNASNNIASLFGARFNADSGTENMNDFVGGDEGLFNSETDRVLNAGNDSVLHSVNDSVLHSENEDNLSLHSMQTIQTMQSMGSFQSLPSHTALLSQSNTSSLFNK